MAPDVRGHSSTAEPLGGTSLRALDYNTTQQVVSDRSQCQADQLTEVEQILSVMFEI